MTRLLEKATDGLGIDSASFGLGQLLKAELMNSRYLARALVAELQVPIEGLAGYLGEVETAG